VYAAYGNVPVVAALFYGLKPAVAAIVAEAVIRIGKKSLKTGGLVALAAAAFVGIYFFNVPFPIIVFSAGAIGYVFGSKIAPAAPNQVNHDTDASSYSEDTGWLRALRVAAFGIVLWFLPLIVLGFWRGWDDILVHIGVLFSKAAIVTFGGAYAVLGYIGQQAVDGYGWLLPEQMMDGLGLAETTPGPLIMVNQFVGYLAAYLHAPGLAPGAAGVIGGLLATWVTFVPSTLWIFIGAPHIENLRRNKKLSSALLAITAAVVGVVLNLSVNFTRHVLLPEAGGFEWYALAASVIAFIGLIRFKWNMIAVITGSAITGFVWKMLI
jgi:chromate transporter